MDYIKEEIPFIEIVRQRQDAHVHALITVQSTGGGGQEYTLQFIGQFEFEHENDELKFTTPADATDDEIREKLVHWLKIGLMRYVSHTQNASHIKIQYEHMKEEKPKPRDRWKRWVFNINLDSYMRGERSVKSINLFTDISASKVTEKLKVELYFGGSYRRTTFKTQDLSVISLNKSYYGGAGYIRAITEHWSWALFFYGRSSSYENITFSGTFSGGIEFNIFPFSESTRRMFRFIYKVSTKQVWYDEETLYGKIKEFLWSHSLRIHLFLIQRWGNISLSIEGSNYFHDLSKNRLVFYAMSSFRLVRGFSFRIGGSYSLIHDQLNLPRRGATPEEVLLQIKELETQYSYYLFFGFEYTFGSIYSEVVNRRF